MHCTDAYHAIVGNVHSVIKGQAEATRILLAAFFSGGHVLLEDVPGTGKTTLAKALACSVDAEFRRIQFTPDLLPSDILGVSVFDRDSRDFRFREGPVFCNLLLADEINRASPRTQSALLEAMAEGQVSIDGVVRPLQQPYLVIATQNPIEFQGTYPLPEAQLDRFCVRIRLGYVSEQEEMEILREQSHAEPLAALQPCLHRDDFLTLREQVAKVRTSPEILGYIVALGRATRMAEEVRCGASPRALLALCRGCQALACFDGLDYLTPDHVQELAEPVFAHRLVLQAEAGYAGTEGADLVRRVLEQVPAPA